MNILQPFITKLFICAMMEGSSNEKVHCKLPSQFQCMCLFNTKIMGIKPLKWTVCNPHCPLLNKCYLLHE